MSHFAWPSGDCVLFLLVPVKQSRALVATNPIEE